MFVDNIAWQLNPGPEEGSVSPGLGQRRWNNAVQGSGAGGPLCDRRECQYFVQALPELQPAGAYTYLLACEYSASVWGEAGGEQSLSQGTLTVNIPARAPWP